jgi:hypothetical protein
MQFFLSLFRRNVSIPFLSKKIGTKKTPKLSLQKKKKTLLKNLEQNASAFIAMLKQKE